MNRWLKIKILGSTNEDEMGLLNKSASEKSLELRREEEKRQTLDV